MKKAFTIIELLVAMGLLAVLIAVSAMAFAMAVKAYRTADASSEILVKLQAITDQLNADFAGLQKDMPLAIWCQYDTSSGRRYDQMLFFADGVFQSVGQYDNDPTAAQNLTIVSGAISRIYYGQADLINFAKRSLAGKAVTQNYWNANVLSRRQHILTSDTGLVQFPVMDNVSFISSFAPFALNGICNDLLEYDLCSMTDWKNVLATPDTSGRYKNAEQFLMTNFFTDLPPAGAIAMGRSNPLIIPLVITPPPPPQSAPPASGRPGIDLSNIQTLPSLMAQGVGSFAVQMGWSAGGGNIRWYFSDDPNGDGDKSDSDFLQPPFTNGIKGFYFNLPAGLNVDTDRDTVNDWMRRTIFPAALKFTFTLYDSAGVFPQGKTFTHIVYIGS